MEQLCCFQDADGKGVTFAPVPRGADGRMPRVVSFEGQVYLEYHSGCARDEPIYRAVEVVVAQLSAPTTDDLQENRA